MVFSLLYKFKNRLDQENFLVRISSLYVGLDTAKIWALLFNSIFVTRRMIFAVACVICKGYATFQIQILSLQCILIAIYLGITKPFKLAINNKIEIFNELTILSVSYHLFLLTDFMPDSKLQYNVGYSLIVFTTLNILVNMIIIVVLGFLSLKEKIKNLIKRWPEIKLKIENRVGKTKKYDLAESETQIQPSQSKNEINAFEVNLDGDTFFKQSRLAIDLKLQEQKEKLAEDNLDLSEEKKSRSVSSRPDQVNVKTKNNTFIANAYFNRDLQKFKKQPQNLNHILENDGSSRSQPEQYKKKQNQARHEQIVEQTKSYKYTLKEQEQRINELKIKNALAEEKLKSQMQSLKFKLN